MEFVKLKRKGSVFDILTIILVLFVVSLTLLFTFKVIGGIKDVVNVMPIAQGNVYAQNVVNSQYALFPSVWDKLLAFIYVGMLMGSLIGAWYIDTSPVFFILSIFLLVFYLIVAVVLNNFYIALLSTSDFANFDTALPIMAWFFNNLLTITLATAGIISLALYAKPNRGGLVA